MKNINTSGKRKRAVARATLKEGKGRITINNKDLDYYEPEMYRLRIMEPLMLAGDTAKNLDFRINVFGGGYASQADAIRLSIGRALVKHNAKLKQVFLDYDRQILVADIRRKESSKPNSHGQARAKRQKSYR
ncbi:MAG: 30S ribosomal protein S9 [Nanoarchaeota archaeon]|nr:30S ribosomal protein S9 [Nanoarchaeota archaeon]